MKTLKNFIAAAICTMFFPIWTADATLQFSNSYFSVIICVFIFLLFQYTGEKKYDPRMKMFTAVLGFLFSSMTSFGYYLERNGQISYKSVSLLISILLYTRVFALGLSAFWSLLMEKEQDWQVCNQALEGDGRFYIFTDFLFHHPLLVGGCFFIMWTPCYISTFPGGFRYDASKEFMQVMNGFNGNLPMLHSAIITRLLTGLHEFTGSYNTGIAVYTILQMLMLAAMFSHIICSLYKQGFNKMILMGLFLYYAIFPVIPMMVTQTVRDVLFSAFLTYTMFLFYLMTSDTNSFMMSRYKPLLLGLMMVLALQSRNNNTGIFMYIIIFAVCILVWKLYRKKYFRGVLIFVITTIGIYCLLGGVLTALCQPMVIPPTSKHSLSVFSQSIVRAYIMEPDSWTAEEKAEFETFVYSESLKYVAENADVTMGRLTVEGNVKEFLKFWLRIGLKHKRVYLDAILAQTRQMWFPDCIIDGYQEMEVEAYKSYDKCYYGFIKTIDEPGVQMQYLPFVQEFYEKIGMFISFERIPILSMMFSIGFQFWILLNCVFYVGYRKCQHLYLPLAVILSYMMISAFVPVVLLRYFVAIFFAMPMIIAFTLQPAMMKSHSS